MLVEKADPSTRMLVGLLVTGLSIDELVQLRRGDLDVERGLIRVHAPPPRTIPLSAPVKDMVTAWAVSPGDPRDPVWQDAHGAALSGSDLAALILTTAHDAALHASSAVTPHTLRHTGIAFLVRQGLNLAELPKIVGWLSNNELAAYALISPPGAELTLEQIDTIHPALRDPRKNSSA
jgi:integrase